MSNERDQDYFPVARLLDEALVLAIDAGDHKAVVAALGEQKPNWVTEAISSRLMARAFLMRQKGKLVTLDESLEGKPVAEVVRLLREYIREMRDEFTEDFGADTDSEGIKLRGDQLFREALSSTDESSVIVARHIISIDSSKLTLPEKVFDWLRSVHGIVTEALGEAIQDAHESRTDDQAVADARRVIADQITRLNRHISSSLPQS